MSSKGKAEKMWLGRYVLMCMYDVWGVADLAAWWSAVQMAICGINYLQMTVQYGYIIERRTRLKANDHVIIVIDIPNVFWVHGSHQKCVFNILYRIN